MGAGLLLLGDPRLTAGGPVDSGGLERAVARGDVRDPDTLTDFLVGRLYGHGAVQATFAAAAALLAGPYAMDATAAWGGLDAALDARVPCTAERAASRARGRALRRLARATWPDEPWPVLGVSPHHAIVLGAAATRAGLGAREAAVLAAVAAVGPPAAAAAALLSFGPLTETVVLGGLTGHCDQIAADAVTAARAGLAGGDWDRALAWADPGAGEPAAGGPAEARVVGVAS